MITGDRSRAGAARRVSALAGAVLLLGVAQSVTGPYLVLYGTGRAGLSPLQIGLLMTVGAVAGIGSALALGRRYDRRPGRGPAVLSACAAAAGFVVLASTTRYAILLTVAAPLLGSGAAAFPQLFALARSYLGEGGRAVPALRSFWSLAWAVGPVAGAALLAHGGFVRLLLATAGAYVSIGLVLIFLGPHPGVIEQRTEAGAPKAGNRGLLPVLVAFTLFHVAMYAGSVVLPLYVTGSLGRTPGDVGLLFSICAVVEIPAALALMLLPDRARLVPLLAVAIGLLAVFCVTTAAGHDLGILIAAQVARGLSIAVVGALGILHFQRLMPDAPGRATTLFTTTSAVGSLVSGLFAGACAQFLGLRPALLACGFVAVVAALLLIRPHVPVARKDMTTGMTNG